MSIGKQRALGLIQNALDQIPDVKAKGGSSQEFKTWQRDTRVALGRIFDEEHSVEFDSISYTPFMFTVGGSSGDQFSGPFQTGMGTAEAMLKSFRTEIKDYWPDDSRPDDDSRPATEEPISDATHDDRVFVVHGRDDSVRATVASFLSRIGLDPIVLQDQPNEGRTIIEKFEDYSDVGFAVVLLTPDDIGGLNGTDENDLKPRPRQNVVLEWGFFLGKLGRDRVAALLQDEVEFPNDYSGVVYIEIDDNEGWKTKLFRELRNARMPVDPNRL